jgi:hypothetical protein
VHAGNCLPRRHAQSNISPRLTDSSFAFAFSLLRFAAPPHHVPKILFDPRGPLYLYYSPSYAIEESISRRLYSATCQPFLRVKEVEILEHAAGALYLPKFESLLLKKAELIHLLVH